MENSEENGEEPGGSGFKVELLRSYWDFARYAFKRKWYVSAVVFVVGLTLTILALIFLPRTFSCSTALMTMGSAVLDGREGVNSALAGAEDLILRHENLEAIIRETNLVQTSEARRPPLLRLKDRISRGLVGPLPDKVKIGSLVGELETKITVITEKGDLTIKVDWSDGKTAAELASAARDSFLRARHSAEISAFEEKMAILDGHASRLRGDIAEQAQQLKAARDDKYNEVRAARSEANKESAAAALANAPRVVRTMRTISPDTQTPELKAKLEGMKTKLAATEADRDQRLRAEQAKLDELKLRFTALHPQVVSQSEKVAMLSQVPSDLMLMRAEVKDLQAEIQQREGAVAQAGGTVSVGGGRTPSGSPELLPPDITDLLQRDNLDPGLTAQLSSTVIKYSALRDELLTTHIELDTAQAAFNHRYQVIIPAEVPLKPEKPKPALVLGGGLFVSLLLSLLLPVLLELRKGVIVERWQVEHLQLPVLAELQLPPYSPD